MRNLSLILMSLLVASVANATPSPETLPSGVVIAKTNTTKGASPTAQSIVKANYRGTLPDGTEFDNSAKHGGPLRFPLGGVIPCWTEGMQKMHVGEKATLTCPANTAYGPMGIPGVIPGNTKLTFQVELVDVQ